MWNTLIKVILQNQNDGVQKVSLKIMKHSEIYRSFNVEVDDEFLVNPVKKNKKKHRDRKVKVHSFVESANGSMRVRVRFLDNGRLGFVDFDDLDRLE
ncbi:hypothetical protein ICE_05348 [Bacillus cereus BAG1X1-2]|uniref:hypothetical protein n=1 Tax=Bacillus cereus TaxID=1396 RepID=UPI00027AA044|nr:hypothetical protein [Bacillus cereus]EJS45938.1 hypothetical protein ICE_05348 [Bacillus cereus BAG1X1-2]